MELNKNEKRIVGIAKTAMAMMILTIISKCFGFVRELAIAKYFGTSYIVDATVMALGIPGMLFGAIFTSISTSFMPNYSEVREKSGVNEGNKFISSVLTLEIIIGVIVILVGKIFSKELVHIFARNFPEQTANLTIKILWIAFIISFIGAFDAILGAYLQYNGKMLIGVINGYLYNVGIVVVVILISRVDKEWYILAHLTGNALKSLVIIIAAFVIGLKFRPNLNISKPVKNMFAMALPVYIGSQIGVINTFVDRTMASGLAEGSIASLNYANLLNGITTSLTIGIISTILYPQINQAVNTEDWSTFNYFKNTIINITILICVPLALGTMVFAEPVTQVVYERGAFKTSSTLMTAECLKFYAISILFSSLTGFLVNFCYSLKDSKTPILYSPITIFVNIVLNLILVKTMAHRGLALATSVASFVSFVLAMYFIPKKHEELKIKLDWIFILKIILSSIVSVVMAMITYKYISMICIVRTINLLLSVIIAIICYFIFMIVFKIKEFMVLLNVFKSR